MPKTQSSLNQQSDQLEEFAIKALQLSHYRAARLVELFRKLKTIPVSELIKDT